MFYFPGYGHPYIAIKDLLDNYMSQDKLADSGEHLIKLLFEMMLEDKEEIKVCICHGTDLVTIGEIMCQAPG